jgi:lipid II:glycine glycyltransferase (peptidoglycan interpeptide bridge formation enzyme)
MDALSTGEASDGEWDHFLSAHPHGHHEQSSRYARERAGCGFRRERVVLREGGRLVGGFQLLARRSPVGTQAIVKRAPLAEGERPDVLARLVDELDRLARRRWYAAIRVDTFPTQLEVRRALDASGFHSGEEWYGDAQTRLLPLDLPDDELLARMKPKGRTAARGAQRAGVTVQAGGGPGLNAFYELHRMTSSYHGFPAFPRAYFQSVWSLFGRSGRAQCFVAYLAGTPVAAILDCVAGGRLYYGWTGTSRDPEHHKLKANYLLQLHAMIWGRDHGCTHYDLAGVSQFKDHLGGDQVLEPFPQRKYYGPFRQLRGALMGLSWSNSTLRRGVQAVAHRLYRPMPF